MGTHGRIVDQHEFTLWRYEDDAVDIHCGREDCPVDPDTAYMEASVLARCLAESIHNTDEVFSVRVYQNGLATTQWRGENGFVQSWAQYKWMRQRLHQTAYDSIVGLPSPPQWAVNCVIALEWLLTRATLAVLLLTGKWRRAAAEDQPPQPAAQAVPATLPDNVVQFPGSRRPQP